MVQEQQLYGEGTAKKRLSMSKVRSGSCEEILHIQGKEQWLSFEGAAMKRYPMSKVRESQIRP